MTACVPLTGSMTPILPGDRKSGNENHRVDAQSVAKLP
jgi:hypothetical protein